jgi:PAS domain S-box-containing protein
VQDLSVSEGRVAMSDQRDEVIGAPEDLFRAAFDDAPVGQVLTAPDGHLLRVNRALCELLGYSDQELLTMNWRDVTHPEDVEPTRREIERAAWSPDARGRLAKRYVRKDGAVVWADVSTRAVLVGGVVKHLVTTIVDITEQKRAEEALRVSEARLRAVLDASNDGFWERDLVTGKVMHSARMNEMLGLPAVDTYPRYDDWLGRMHPDDREKLQPIYDRVLSGKEERIDLVFRTRRADGSWMWVRARAKVSARKEGGEPTRFSGTITDVHQGMVAQVALRESEARFRTLTDSAPVGIFQTDASGKNVFLNPAGATMSGLTPEEAQGAGWSAAIHPEDKERVFREWTDATAAGRDFSSEYRFLARDGAVTWVRCFGSGIRDPDGRSSGCVGVFVDLTAQRIMQEQLQVASRLAAMGTLVAGVAHEINNPLAGTMAGQGSTIEDLRELRERAFRREAIDPDSLVRELDEDLGSLTDAQMGAQRIARIVKDLVAFGRPDPRRTRVRLIDVVEEGMRWLPGSNVASTTIRVVNEEAPEVIASSGQLSQVVVNLVTNAAKSTPLDRRGVVTVRIGPGSRGMARLDVTDDGAGIRPEVLARIFDPFFTTREVGQGMGLGLPICHAIVTAHGGTITVASELGKGSTFRVELPAAPAEA